MPLPILIRTYRQFRATPASYYEGHNAKLALRCARILLEWKELESQGVVRLRVESDDDYERDDDNCTCKRHDGHHYQCDICRHLERDGAVGIIGEYRQDSTEDEDEGWEHADSVWGCAGYDKPASPFENCYVIDIMDATMDAYLTSNANTTPQL